LCSFSSIGSSANNPQSELSVLIELVLFVVLSCLSSKLCIIACTRHILLEGVSESSWFRPSCSGIGSNSLSVVSSILTWTGIFRSFFGCRYSFAQYPCFLQLKYFPFGLLLLARPVMFSWCLPLVLPCLLLNCLVWTILRSIGCSYNTFC
jgi:hypothetical protein